MGLLYPKLGQDAPAAWIRLDPLTGVVAWGVANLPSETEVQVFVGLPGEVPRIYASCGVGADGTCGQSRQETWLPNTPDIDFVVQTAGGEVLAAQSIRGGVVQSAVLPAASPAASPASVPAGTTGPGTAGTAAGGDLIAGIPNTYLAIGGAALAGLILLKKKR